MDSLKSLKNEIYAEITLADIQEIANAKNKTFEQIKNEIDAIIDLAYSKANSKSQKQFNIDLGILLNFMVGHYVFTVDAKTLKNKYNTLVTILCDIWVQNAEHEIKNLNERISEVDTYCDCLNILAGFDFNIPLLNFYIKNHFANSDEMLKKFAEAYEND